MSKTRPWNTTNDFRRHMRGVERQAALPSGEAAWLRAAALTLIDTLDPSLFAFTARSLLRYFGEHGWALDLEPMPLDEAENPKSEVEQLRAIVAMLDSRATEPAPTALDLRLHWLATTLALDDVERAVVGIFARRSIFDPWSDLLNALPGAIGELRASTLSLLTGRSSAEIERRMQAGAVLLRVGLLVDDGDHSFHAGRFLRIIARLDTTDAETLSAQMMPPAPRSTLAWDDFDHLDPVRDAVVRAVGGAAAAGRGISVLLHGMPGTGKSEFARALADRLGLVAVFAGLTDDEGGEPHRRERIAHLNVLRALTRGSSRHLIVVDEADDVLTLRGDDRQSQSKLWLNRLVEDVETPTLWIANDADVLGESIVRRASLAIAFTLPPRRVRSRVIERHAATRGLSIDADMLADAAALQVAPAVLANSVDAAMLAGGDAAVVEVAAGSVLKALGGTRKSEPKAGVYDAKLANADTDLACLADRLVRTPSRGWSVLLSGPSGTGKSAYARHLAERLGIEVDERRGSDLLSMWVGGTEAAIAEAFQSSAERGTMLLIDEADSFLDDRRGSRNSWEVSMTNEMLRWMEQLRAPFVATTNRADALDPASQRRFTMRVAFAPLTVEQVAGQFALHFGGTAPQELLDLDALTPGDFAVVAHRARLLGEHDVEQLIAWLHSEAEAREGRSIVTGFRVVKPVQVLSRRGRDADAA